MHPKSEDRLIVALDVSSAAAAQRIVAALGDSAFIYKVGMQLYTAEGPQIVRDLVSSGRRVFLDLKYHDIPNTVGAAVSEAAKLESACLPSMDQVVARCWRPRWRRQSPGPRLWCWRSRC